MGYLLLTLFGFALAALLAFVTLRLLFVRNWFLGWLRGMLGMVLIATVLIVTAVAFDIYSYRQVLAEQTIATISFTAIAPQHYRASFVDNNGHAQDYELRGDQWQLDSRIIKWQGIFATLGMKTGYRLERISGRYLSLDDERNKARSVYPLSTSIAGIDLWQWLNDRQNTGVVDARYGNSTFLPMVDGGQYQVAISVSGLLARPLNQPARDAVAQWH
ncbi:MAG: cation/multidrug efflux pump [Cellvibrionaceae bacterium]|nr:cation/multidrug efflux pump [Cellvibrionaceae bacterium]